MKQYLILSTMLLTVPLVGCGANNTSTLIVTTEQNEEGTVTGSGSYAWNSDVTIKATPNTNYVFDGWYVDGEKVASTAEYTFKMPQKNVAYLARFIAESYLLEISSEDTSKGTVWGDFGLYPWGTRVTVVATPGPGYNFEGWYVDDERIIEGTSTYFFDMPQTDIKLVAKFTQTVIHSLNIKILPEQDAGTVSGQGVYELGQKVVLNATVDSKYSFQGWYLDKVLVSDELSYEVTMGDKDVVYEACYVRKKYGLTIKYDASKVEKVTISAQPPITWGQKIRVDIKPREDYGYVVIISARLNGHSIHTSMYSTSVEFYMPAQDSELQLNIGRPSSP